jgi:hypothetical protein
MLAVGRVRLPRPAATAALGALAIAVVAWNLGGEIAGARGAESDSKTVLNGFPLLPLNRVDLTVGSGSVTYLGQQLQQDVNGVDLLEFWNRSIKKLWSLDGSTPGPGPTLSPDFAADGTLSPAPGTDYLLADAGVDPIGESALVGGQLRLFRLDGGPIRVRSLSSNVGSDGWMVTDASYTRFVTPGHRPGVAVIDLSRANFCPEPSAHAPVGWIHVLVGEAVINENHQPIMGRVLHDSHVNLPNCSKTTLRIPVGPPPWRVELHVDGTFSPAQYGTSSDARTLGAQVGFDYAAR